jgi:hypothetical protein
MIGAYSISRGITKFDQVDISVYRHLMLYFGAINIFILFYVVYLSSNISTATLASLIYATVPTHVLSLRLPISDNMVATFSLLAVLFIILYLQSKLTLWLVLSALVSGSALLLKSTGVFIPVAIVAILFSKKQFKASITIIVSTAIFLGLWFLYGYYYNWDVFLKIMSLSSGRELFSPTVIINLFETFRIGEKTMGIDGWFIWGWISLVAFSFIKFNKKEISKTIVPFMIGSYLVFFTIMSGHIKGWYRDPFYPYLSWAMAAFLVEVIRRPRLLTSFFFVTIPFFSSYIYGNGGIRYNDSQIKIFQFAFVSLMTPFMLHEIFRHKVLLNICRVLILILFMFSIIYNARTILYFQDFFYYHNI